MFARELTMHGSRLYTRADWEEAIRLASTGMEEALAGGPVMKVLVDLG
jgi:hypothetical protein